MNDLGQLLSPRLYEYFIEDNFVLLLLKRLHLAFLSFFIMKRWQWKIPLQRYCVQCIHCCLLLCFLFLFIFQSLFLQKLVTLTGSALIIFFLWWLVLLEISNSILLQEEPVLLISVHWLFFISIVILKFIKFYVGHELTI